tara:strand:- start:99 stop:278 length:180 start_codon:yes stop_codon:yes gene_type:complete
LAQIGTEKSGTTSPTWSGKLKQNEINNRLIESFFNIIFLFGLAVKLSLSLKSFKEMKPA